MKWIGSLHYYLFYTIKTPVQFILDSLRSIEDFSLIFLPNSAHEKACELHTAELNEMLDECKKKGLL